MLMGLMNIHAIQTFITGDRIEVEKAGSSQLPNKVEGIVVQESKWDYYRDVFGDVDICYQNGWTVNTPIKTFKYQHPYYGKLRVINSHITLNLVREGFKHERIYVWLCE